MVDNKKQVTVKIVGDNSGLIKSTNEAQGVISKFAKSTGIAVGATVASLVALGTKSVMAFATMETEQKKVIAALKATGSQAGVTANDIFALGDAIEKTTTFAGGDVAVMQAQLLKFGNIKKDIFEPTTRAIVDMSAALGTDLLGTAALVGKALENPLQGINLLRRSGVNFTEEQKNLIKELLASNDVLGAQTIILDQLNGKFKGTAEELAKGTGIFAQIKEVLTALFEQVGMVIFRVIEPAIKGIYKFATALKDSGAVASVTYEIMGVLKGGLQLLYQAYQGVVVVGKAMHAVLRALPIGYETLTNAITKTSSSLNTQIGIVDSLKALWASAIGFMIRKAYEATAAYYKLQAGAQSLKASIAGVFSDDAKARIEAQSAATLKLADDYTKLAEGVQAATDAQLQNFGGAKAAAVNEAVEGGDTLFGEQTERLNFSGEEEKGGGATGKQKFEGDYKIDDTEGLDALQRAGLAPLSDEQREELKSKLEAQRAEDLSDLEKYQLEVLKTEEAFTKKMQDTFTGFLSAKFRNAEASNEEIETADKEFQANMLASLKLFGKSGAKIMAAFQIADAIRSTYQAANRALAAYAPPLSYIAAAAAVSAGLANVAQIRNQAIGGAANGAIVGGIDNGKDSRIMAVRPGEMIVPSQYVQPLMPSLADLVRGEDRNGVIGSNGGGGSQEIMISFKGDAEQFIQAQLVKGRVSGVI